MSGTEVLTDRISTSRDAIFSESPASLTQEDQEVLSSSPAILFSVSDARVGDKLTHLGFQQLAGTLAGTPFIKIVFDRQNQTIHFINNRRYRFHGEYIAERLLGITVAQLTANIDHYNEGFYLKDDRRFFLGILAWHTKKDRKFYTLETVEIDNMDVEMMKAFYKQVRDFVDPAAPILWKPANHLQEAALAKLAPSDLPRIYAHELYQSAQYLALNPGKALGRLRAFRTEADYRVARGSLEWFDILVMHRVPDDVPRLAGIINAEPTTPLSHTNVLASGWQIPNAVQVGVFDRISAESLDGAWVHFEVDPNGASVVLMRAEAPKDAPKRPSWALHRIQIEEPETANTAIQDLSRLRMSDRYKYGTKAANLGEICHVLENGSERLLGFYKIRRPPRPNLLPHLAKFLGVPENSDLSRAAWQFLKANVTVPRGIAIPFSVQQEFLQSSPRIQQAIGKLKMALELEARQVDALCLGLQQLIRSTRMPDAIRLKIDAQIANHLAGVSSFVVRSSSNAEDLENFSAAGIYESINHATTAEKIFEAIKEVWASLCSPRSVRLRSEVGISLDDSYMGVVVQEEVPASVGGVLVTTNPMKRGSDFRNVYLNVSMKSVENVVHGSELPHQYLFNTVEGGGMTIAVPEGSQPLSGELRNQIQNLAFSGRLLQSHFSKDYTFGQPVDIEWIADTSITGAPGIVLLQLRPYAG
ncbi:MAG: hypothetical protein JNL01_02785 [Bdellovibrionales bacterium]|nr:hypothetical protein [Bdellovibrionales bacterium]